LEPAGEIAVAQLPALEAQTPLAVVDMVYDWSANVYELLIDVE
jgi:hypothetical protein